MEVSQLPWKWPSAPEVFLALVAIAVASVLYRWISWKIKKLPPGPMGLPIVGYLPFLGSKPHETFDQLRYKYGPVFSLYLGSNLVVVLGDLKVIKEAFGQDAFLDRPVDSTFNIQEGVTGFGQASGPSWKEQRRFALHVLRDLGFGRKQMEVHITEEIADFIEWVAKKKGAPFDLSLPIFSSVSNNIAALVYGRRFEPDHPMRLFLENFLDSVTRFFQQTSIHAFFPWLKYFLFRFNLLGYGEAQKILQTGKQFNSEEVTAHQKTLDIDNPRDYIDRFLIEREVQAAKDQNHSFTDEMLLGNIGVLFGAGTDTVRNSTRWAMLLMATYPEIQTRVQREIDDVLGSETRPRWTDNPNLPLTQAVLMEVQRWVTLVPINLPRSTNTDTVVNRYVIPKGTTVIANFWGAHHDPLVWKAPFLFNPERFLEENRAIKSDALIPFSFGKRSCPGEFLANVETFLYFVSLLQRFTVKLPDGSGKPDFEGILGITLAPKPHQLCFIERK